MVEPFRSPMDVKDLLSLLETVKQSDNGWTARCPAHDDRKPSLSVGVGADGRILVRCHAGCEIEAICRKLEIEQRDLFPATTDHGHSPRQEPYVVYDYDNLFQVLRYPGKKFLQRRPDGNDGWIWNTQGVKPRLYHLNDLAGHKQVIVAEGEKDVDRLRQLGLAATCNSGGAGKWQAAHAEQLRGVEVQRVVVIPDADDAGRKHGLTVARTCAAAGLTVNIVNLPDDAKDVSEFLGGSRDRAALIKCIDAAAVYSPETEAAGELPDGWVFLSDVEATAELGPPVVARGLAWAGRVSLLHSREKVGKSTITTAMTAAVTRGKSFLEQPTRQGPVVWFSEEHPADVRKRLEQWGADCSCVAFGGRLDKSPESPASLKSLVTQIKPVLVIVDTLTKWAGALGIRDLHGAGELGQRLAELVTLAWSCPSSVDTYPLGEEEESTMPKSRPPYPAAFRQQMVELVRSGRTPGELAREFEPSAEAIRNWAAQADRDAGKRSDGLRTEEHEEIRRLRRENRQLREEREILAKATAWFARETGPGRSTGS